MSDEPRIDRVWAQLMAAYKVSDILGGEERLIIRLHAELDAIRARTSMRDQPHLPRRLWYLGELP